MHHIQNPILCIGHPDNFVEVYGEKRATATFTLSPEEIAAGRVTVLVKNEAHIARTISCGTAEKEILAEGILAADLSRPYQSIFAPNCRLAYDVIGNLDVVDACVTQWDVMEFAAINAAMRDYMEDAA